MNSKFFLFLLIMMAFSCNDGSKYSIHGKITNAEGKYIYLDEFKLKTTENIDSVKIDKNGLFKIEGKVSIPTYFLLRLGENEKNFIMLLVDSAEHIEISADMSNFSQEYDVKGSGGSILVQELNMRLSKTKHQLDSIRTLQTAFRNNIEEQRKWENEYEEIKRAQIEYSKDFVIKHPFSMANVLALYQKFDDENYVVQDLQSLKVAASALNSFFPHSELVQALYANTLKLMKDERTTGLQQFIHEHGENSPNIILPNPDGKEIALSSLKGKYVLLHFWAGADHGSRIMNPVLVDLYKRYRYRNFEIYQVSLDINRLDWTAAIDADKLTWINVCDGAGSKDAVIKYNVTELPFNYLIDKEGSIIAKNIKGPALTNLLEKIL